MGHRREKLSARIELPVVAAQVGPVWLLCARTTLRVGFASGFGIGSALYKPGMDAAAVGASARAFADAWAGTMRA